MVQIRHRVREPQLIANKGQSGAPFRLAWVPLLLSTWFWALTFFLRALFSPTSLITKVLCPSWELVASPCPCRPQPNSRPVSAAVWSPGLTPSFPLSLNMAALCGPRGTRAQTRVGYCLRVGFCGSLKTNLALCTPRRRPTAGGRRRKENLF